jgi:hypothetical protein
LLEVEGGTGGLFDDERLGQVLDNLVVDAV